MRLPRRLRRGSRSGGGTGIKPMFVGGTGRSGTTITARLLGSHPAYEMIPTETRFITAPGGLCHLAAGKTGYLQFEQQIRGPWFHRGPRKGLHMIMEPATVEAALPALRDGLRSDPWAAARAFTHQLLDPIAIAAGAQGWIEMSPTNAVRARELWRMFPDLKLVHSLRDGRDVACSVIGLRWGPTDLDEALDWWARKLERGFAACDSLPPDRVLVVQLEELTAWDREGQYGRLLAFLGLDDDPAMREFFATRMSADRAHTGRWRDDVPPERLAAFEARYRALAEGLRR